MTVMVYIGRRVPQSWYRRIGSRVKGLMTFQENIWQIICDSLRNAKKKAVKDGRLEFNITKDTEVENMNYKIEWRKVIIKGPYEMELEDYNEANAMYDKMGKKFKKDFDVDDNLAKRFKTKMLNQKKVDDAYKKGYGAVKNNNISNKLLEMGIMTYVEWIDDFDNRS